MTRLRVICLLAGVLATFCNCRVVFTAKGIEKNFKEVTREISELKQSIEVYRNYAKILNKKSRNDTILYNQLLDKVNSLQGEIENLKDDLERQSKYKITLTNKTEENSRQIYNVKTDLLNKINTNQYTLLQRIERLEQSNVKKGQTLAGLEERLSSEKAKNERLATELDSLKRGMRRIYNNMTFSINQLRAKHQSATVRLLNMSHEGTDKVHRLQIQIATLEDQIQNMEETQKALLRRIIRMAMQQKIRQMFTTTTQATSTTTKSTPSTISTTITTTTMPSTTSASSSTTTATPAITDKTPKITTTTTTTTPASTTNTSPSTTTTTPEMTTIPATTTTTTPTTTTTTTTSTTTTTNPPTTSSTTSPTTLTTTTTTTPKPPLGEELALPNLLTLQDFFEMSYWNENNGIDPKYGNHEK